MFRWIRKRVWFGITLLIPLAIHDAYHAIDGLSGWRANQILPWIAWLFESHEVGSAGFISHAIMAALAWPAILIFLLKIKYWIGVALENLKVGKVYFDALYGFNNNK